MRVGTRLGRGAAVTIAAAVLVPVLAISAPARRAGGAPASVRRTARVAATPLPVRSDLAPAAAPSSFTIVRVRRPRRTARPRLPRTPRVPRPTKPPSQPAPQPPQPPQDSGVHDDFEAYPAGRWDEGSVHGPWRVVFGGFGTVETVADGSRALSLRPKPAVAPDETHAALVATSRAFGDADVTMRVRTASTLRTGSPPNPWEVGWVLWRYTDNTHFYSLVLKPEGWELGKEDPAYPGAQRFLATGTAPFPRGSWYTVRVRHVGATITVWVDGVQLVQFTDQERPYADGSVALYTEDAEAHFDDVSVTAQPSGS